MPDFTLVEARALAKPPAPGPASAGGLWHCCVPPGLPGLPPGFDAQEAMSRWAGAYWACYCKLAQSYGVVTGCSGGFEPAAIEGMAGVAAEEEGYLTEDDDVGGGAGAIAGEDGNMNDDDGGADGGDAAEGVAGNVEEAPAKKQKL